MSADERERAHAAKSLLVDARGPNGKDEDLELVAFMAIFHPDRKDRPHTQAEARKWRGEDR